MCFLNSFFFHFNFVFLLFPLFFARFSELLRATRGRFSNAAIARKMHSEFRRQYASPSEFPRDRLDFDSTKARKAPSRRASEAQPPHESQWAVQQQPPATRTSTPESEARLRCLCLHFSMFAFSCTLYKAQGRLQNNGLRGIRSLKSALIQRTISAFCEEDRRAFLHACGNIFKRVAV